jgi:hypothetical protein
MQAAATSSMQLPPVSWAPRCMRILMAHLACSGKRGPEVPDGVRLRACGAAVGQRLLNADVSDARLRRVRDRGSAALRLDAVQYRVAADAQPLDYIDGVVQDQIRVRVGLGAVAVDEPHSTHCFMSGMSSKPTRHSETSCPTARAGSSSVRRSRSPAMWVDA